MPHRYARGIQNRYEGWRTGRGERGHAVGSGELRLRECEALFRGVVSLCFGAQCALRLRALRALRSNKRCHRPMSPNSQAAREQVGKREPASNADHAYKPTQQTQLQSELAQCFGHLIIYHPVREIT